MIPGAAVEAAAAAIEARMFGPVKLGELARAALEAADRYMLVAKVAEVKANNDHIVEGGDGFSAGFHYALQCLTPEVNL